MTRTHPIGTLLWILALTFAAACAGAADATDATDATEPVQAATVVAPDAEAAVAILRQLPARLDDCSIVSGPVIYDSGALAEHLGDGTEDLLAYAHQWTVRATYAIPAGGPQVSVDIHRMSSEMAAYGAFCAEREPSAELPAPLIRASSYWLGANLCVWRGEFYVCAGPVAGAAVLREPVRRVAEAAVESIPLPDRLPPLLRILPCRSRQMPLPRYHQGAAPGFGFPADAMTLTYLEGFEQHCHFLLARCADADAAAAAYEQLVGELYDGDNGVEPLGQITDQQATIQTTEEGTAAVMQQDNFVAAVWDSHDAEFAEGILRMSAINIRIHLLMD